MEKRDFFLYLFLAVAIISLSLNGFLVYTLVKDAEVLQQQDANKKILDFRNLFTQKVLLSDQPVDFDTRLTLETAVRALNDKDIFNQWQKFTSSQTQKDATVEAKKLLDLLIKKSL